MSTVVDSSSNPSLSIQEEIAEAFLALNPDFPPSHIHVLGSIEEAVKFATRRPVHQGGEVDVLVAGSLHLVGGVMEVAELGREEIGGLSLE